MVKHTPGANATLFESGLTKTILNDRLNRQQTPFTNTLYVSPDGDGSDGSSWEKAYTTIEDAIAGASADLNDMTNIIIATGTYDINTSGILAIGKNIQLISASEFTVAIINEHASATGIFQVTEETIFKNISLTANNNITTIEFNGANTGGSRLENVILSSLTASSAHTLLKFTNGASSVICKNIKVVGNPTYTTGIDVQANTLNSVFEDIQVFYCILGVRIQTGSLLVQLDRPYIFGCASGIQIDSTATNVILKDITILNCATEITDNGTNTFIDRPIEIDSLAGIDGFTEIIYVSPAGDDSNGKSWAGAINNLWDAIQLASTSANHMTLILCAPAEYDVNITGDPDINRNVTIRGIGGTQGVGVAIKNDHASATSVLKFTKVGGLFNLAIDLGTSNNGILWSGSDCVQGRMENLDIVMAALTSQKVGVTYENCAFHSAKQVYYIGNPTYAVGLKFDNIQYYIDFDCLYLDCLLGITSTHASDDYMVFSLAFIHGCATGISLTAACNDFFLHEPHFSKNTTNFTAVAAADYTMFQEQLDREVIKMYPADSSAVVNITNDGAAAGVYGAYVEVVAASAITKPFKIIGIAVMGTSDGNAMYFVDLAWGASDIIIATLPIRGSVGVSTAQSPAIESGIIPEDSRVRARISTSNGGADNIDIFLQYVEI